MNARRLLAALAVVALAATSAAASDPLRDPWAGFAPGSSVHQRTTTRTGAPNAPDTVTESRTTLLKAEKGVLTLNSEFRVGRGEWRGQVITMDATAKGAGDAPAPETIGEEKLTIDGKELACRVQRTTTPEGVTTAWVHPDYGIVRSESKAAGGAVTRLSLEKLAAKVKVGAEEIECRQVVTVTTTSAGTSTTTMYLSTAVPGGVVRSEVVTTHGRMRLTMTTETVEYLVKR